MSFLSFVSENTNEGYFQLNISEKDIIHNHERRANKSRGHNAIKWVYGLYVSLHSQIQKVSDPHKRVYPRCFLFYSLLLVYVTRSRAAEKAF